jgi:hypothetical protein
MPRNHFRLLKEAGYLYDSSWHPACLPHRPWDCFKRKSPFLRWGIVEIPISTLAGVPISWIWMRNGGLWLAKWGVYYNWIFQRPAVFYLHSWEFEALPVVAGLPNYIIHKTGSEFLNAVQAMIGYFKSRGFHFQRLDCVAENLGRVSKVSRTGCPPVSIRRVLLI